MPNYSYSPRTSRGSSTKRSNFKPSGSRGGGYGGNRNRSGGNRRGPKTSTIHPSKFVNKAVKPQDEVSYEPKHLFKDFPFSEQLHKNIERKGYTAPSAIQDQSIMPIIQGSDLIGLANTGTGKTAAFLLPLLDKIEKKFVSPQVLVVAPTRELAQQIDQQFKEFSFGMKLYSAIVVGGTNIDRQIRDIKRGVHVIIGTPGRLEDLVKRDVLGLDQLDVVVLDEADRMLDMGFLPSIRRIMDMTKSDRQTLFFSATISPEVQRLTNDFLKDPVTVSVRKSETSEHIEQTVIEARDKVHKLELLHDMLQKDEYEKVLVFGETKFGVQRLSDALSVGGIKSVAIHGNKTQGQRQRALKQFKNNEVRVLVATDVAARGLDIPNVSHVINFDAPAAYEDYVHRIGRTGRGGARGTAHTFVAAQSR